MMQTFFMYVVITVLMSPVLAFCGIPFIAAAALFSRLMRARLAARTRLITAAAFAALGVAPVFDEFLMPRPVYLVLWAGDAMSLRPALASFAITWTLIALVLFIKARRSTAKNVVAGGRHAVS